MPLQVRLGIGLRTRAEAAPTMAQTRSSPFLSRFRHRDGGHSTNTTGSACEDAPRTRLSFCAEETSRLVCHCLGFAHRDLAKL